MKTKIRIVHPTDNIEKNLSFYRDGLGLEVLNEFQDIMGFDGVVLGHKEWGVQLELSLKQGVTIPKAPTQDNLIAFFIPDENAFQAAVKRLKSCGYPPVAAYMPWWDQVGKTFEDPDGYRVVLVSREMPDS